MGVHSAKLNVVCVSESSWGGSGISCVMMLQSRAQFVVVVATANGFALQS